MMIGAKIVVHARMDLARDGLAGLSGGSWMMSLPRRKEDYSGHPAGRARPTLPALGRSALIAVTFGNLATSAGPGTVLPVRWESVEPGDNFAVLLDADITLDPAAGQAHSSVLTLAGVCRLLPATLAANGHDKARLEVIEAARTFITSVADTVTRATDPGLEHERSSPAWSWVTEPPRAR